MSSQKKPYVKPNIEFHPAGSPAYNRFMALLAEEQQEAEKNSSADAIIPSSESISPSGRRNQDV